MTLVCSWSILLVKFFTEVFIWFIAFQYGFSSEILFIDFCFHNLNWLPHLSQQFIFVILEHNHILLSYFNIVIIILLNFLSGIPFRSFSLVLLTMGLVSFHGIHYYFLKLFSDFLLGLVYLKQVFSCIFLFSQIAFLPLVWVHITFSIRFTVIGLGCCLIIAEFILSRTIGPFVLIMRLSLVSQYSPLSP